MGMDVRIGAPKAYWPSQELIDMCREFAKASGARITITEDPEAAVKGWTSSIRIFGSLWENQRKFGMNVSKRFCPIKSIKTDGSFRQSEREIYALSACLP